MTEPYGTSPATAQEWTDSDAVLFDLDGVLTPTALVHERAWQQLFDEYLAQVGQSPYKESDYFDFIDGKPRFDGVRDFLASRGIVVEEGPFDDDPSSNTVHGLGNRKNLVFNTIITTQGVEPYPGSVRFIEAAQAQGLKLAVVSSSRNAPAVLEAAGLAKYFEVVVDGELAAAKGIPGKPAPDTYTYGAQLLGVPSNRALVVEDAVSGVQAGAAGDFRAVIGIDRGAGHQTLLQAGADYVVDDLDELL